MPRTTQEAKAETVTFRLDPTLKAGLAEVAEQEAKPVGELLRELVRERIERQRRQAFEAEARRQSAIIATAAADPDSDEAELMRWIEGAAETEGWEP